MQLIRQLLETFSRSRQCLRLREIRILPVIVVLAVSPLVILRYWMWRVRLKQNLRGLMIARLVDTAVAVKAAIAPW